MVAAGCAKMKILFLTENFPPETNAAATRVHERACFWVKPALDSSAARAT
jgi:hypothetical protein